MSDIDTVIVDSLKTLDPNRPIREADIHEVEFLAFPEQVLKLPVGLRIA